MNRAGFEKLVHSLSRKLYGYAYRILKDQEEAEDTVQEVFLKLWRMNERLSEYKSLDALASTMTKNMCIDQLRKQRQIKTGDSATASLFSSSDPSPQEQMENSETFMILDRIIGELPESYREMIQLKDIDGLSYEEIALKTNQNINTIRVTISRARKTVREEYKRKLYGNGEDKGTA